MLDRQKFSFRMASSGGSELNSIIDHDETLPPIRSTLQQEQTDEQARIRKHFGANLFGWGEPPRKTEEAHICVYSVAISSAREADGRPGEQGVRSRVQQQTAVSVGLSSAR